MIASLREQHQELNTRGNIIAVITQDMVKDDNLKRQIKTELCIIVDYSN